MALLQAQDLSLSFGGVKAVRGVTFDVAEGEVFSIIGPNGAGKTTCSTSSAASTTPTPAA